MFHTPTTMIPGVDLTQLTSEVDIILDVPLLLSVAIIRLPSGQRTLEITCSGALSFGDFAMLNEEFVRPHGEVGRFLGYADTDLFGGEGEEVTLSYEMV